MPRKKSIRLAAEVFSQALSLLSPTLAAYAAASIDLESV